VSQFLPSKQPPTGDNRQIGEHQTEGNLSMATETLYDYLINRRLRIYRNEDLRAHILNASTKETERVFWLKKDRQAKKIDAAVALSFAILAAVLAMADRTSGPANYKPTVVITRQLGGILRNYSRF
jgi:phage terminase large subunit-like protein